MIDFGYGVILHSLDRGHLPKLRAWRNDARIWRWCRQHDVISEAHQERWFEHQSDAPALRMYTVRVRKPVETFGEEETVVGVAGLTSIDWVNRRAEFSLYIAPEYQGNGYGEMGLKTLLAHGFRNLNLHSIWGETYEGNRALEMFYALGFQFEGTRREHYFRNGRYIDAHLVSLLAREFEAKWGSP